MIQAGPTGYDLETCAWCGGSGKAQAGERCGVCPGTGYVMVTQPSLACPDCHCTGRDGSYEMCRKCGGAGWLGRLRAEMPKPEAPTPEASKPKAPESKPAPARDQRFEEFEEFLRRHK